MKIFAKIKQRHGYFWWLLVLLVDASLAANFKAAGHLKSFFVLQDDIAVSNIPDDVSALMLSSNRQVQNSIRIQLGKIGESAHVFDGNIEVHYEVRPSYHSNDFVLDTLDQVKGANRYRFTDLNSELQRHNAYHITLQNLDRFNYQYNGKEGDFTIGRQALVFGPARFFSPTDIFIPYDIQVIDQEYRIGIDAIRYQMELGQLSMLDMGAVIGRDADAENSGIFFRGKTSISGNDLEGTLIVLDNARLIGLGVERAFGDFGFWLETAYMKWQLDEQANYTRTSVGTDYAFNERLTGLVEYHYNGAGERDPEHYLALMQRPSHQRAGVFLLGQHYLVAAISWMMTPLTSLTETAFYNLSDQSIFYTLAIQHSWSDNLYSDLGVYLSAGDRPYFSADEPIQLGSEFGVVKHSLYLSLRYYY